MNKYDRSRKETREIFTRNDELTNLITKISMLIFVGVLLILAFSCKTVIHATSASGEAMEANGNYGYVLLRSEKGKADYNAFFQVYFPYQVKKGEKVFMVTQSYLDSLKTVNR